METVKIHVCDLESCAITILLKDLRTFISLLGVFAAKMCLGGGGVPTIFVLPVCPSVGT
jgi:hypothetical protein